MPEKLLLILLALLLGSPVAASAQPLKAFVDTPLRTAMARMAGDLKSMNIEVEFDYSSAPAHKARLAAGEKPDVILSLAADVALLQRDNKASLLSEGIARIKLGLAVRDGVSFPKIDSLDDLKRAFASADSIIHNDVASGRAFVAQLDKAGLREQFKAKLVEVPVSAGVMPEIVKRSGRDLGIVQMPQIVEFASKGIRLAGALPPEVQVEIVYSAAVLTAGSDKQIAASFVRYLASPAGVAAFAAVGAR